MVVKVKRADEEERNPCTLPESESVKTLEWTELRPSRPHDRTRADHAANENFSAALNLFSVGTGEEDVATVHCQPGQVQIRHVVQERYILQPQSCCELPHLPGNERL